MKTCFTVGVRYAILAVLGMALMIIAKPTKASALTCLQTCEQDEQNCENMCHADGFPNCKYCEDIFNACVSTCD
jgi:hypothetical protein